MPKEALQLECTYHWPADGESRPWTEFWVTTQLGPVGRIRGGSILYSLDDGRSWHHRPMEKACLLGDREVWHVNLGIFPAGTRIRYAVEGVDRNGESHWDNHHGKDYRALIGSTIDFQAV